MEELEIILKTMKELDSKSSNLDELTDGIVGLVASYLEGRSDRDESYKKLVEYLGKQDLSKNLSCTLDLMNLR